MLNNKWSWNFFAEGHYIVGKSDMLCVVYACVTVNCLLAQIVNLWFDLRHRFFVIDLIDRIENSRNIMFELSQQLKSKFSMRVTLLCKLFFKIVFYQMFFGCNLITYLTSIMGFLDPSMDFGIPSLIFWLSVLTIFWWNIFSLAMASVAMAYITITFIKFQFRDIHQTIKSYSQRNQRRDGI